MTMEQILEKIKQDHGEAVFGNGNQLLSLFADYSRGQMRPQQNQLDIFIKCEGNTRILKVGSATSHEQQAAYNHLIRKMVEEYGLQEQVAMEICGAFWQAVHDTPAPVNRRVIPPQHPKKQPRSTPSFDNASDYALSRDASPQKDKNDTMSKRFESQKKGGNEKGIRSSQSSPSYVPLGYVPPAERLRDRILMIWTFFSFVPIFCMLGFYDAEPGIAFFCEGFMLLDLLVTILKSEKIKIFIPILEVGVFLSGLPYVFSKISVPKDSLGYPVVIFVMIVVTIWAISTVIVHIFFANFEKVKAYFEAEKHKKGRR